MGVGENPKKAEIITSEQENHLWNPGVLEIEMPKSFLHVHFYYNGKTFHLRGEGEEHHFSTCESYSVTSVHISMNTLRKSPKQFWWFGTCVWM